MRRAWRGGAPRTSHALPHFISAFTLSYVALLDSLFAPLLFLSRSFASSYLCYTYFVNETVLLAPLSFLFLSSLRSTDISISTFVALSNFHITALFRNYVPQRCFLPLYFASSLWFRGCKNDSLEYLLDESFIHVCRFIRQTGRKERRVIIKTDAARPSPLHLRYRLAAVSVPRPVSPVDYFRLLHI